MLLASIALCVATALPLLVCGNELPRPNLLSFSTVKDADTSSVHLRITAPEQAGAKVAILDGFRIVGYSTIGADGTGEFSLVDPTPGQHWLRISAAGKVGERSEAVPVVILASWTKAVSANNRLSFPPMAGEGLSSGEREELGQSILLDLNQDNIEDRLVIRRSSITAAMGDGHSGFSALRPVPGERTALKFSGTSSISDWNEDGFPDLAFGADGGILFCFGDGQGGFRSTQWVEGVSLPAGEVAGDLNGDGHSDLLVLQTAESGVTLAGLIGDGHGAMALRSVQSKPEPLAHFAARLDAEDRDGDGIIDFIQAGEEAPQRWRRSTDGMFHLDAAKQPSSGPLTAVASAPERSATTWGTTAYGQILTVAGGGTNSLGDGGPATAAKLSNIYDFVVDSAQNLFLADPNNGRIRKVAKNSGVLTTVAGGGSASPVDGGLATNAYLSWAPVIATDDLGNLFVAQLYDNRILKVNSGSGLISSIAGTGELGFGGDGQSAATAKLNRPLGIAVDSARNFYIADSGNHRIRKVSVATGNIETVAGIGTAGFSGDGSAATNAQLYDPRMIRIDANANIVFIDASNGRVRRVSAATGLISTVAGGGPLTLSDGALATSVTLNSIDGLSIDNTGSIYIASGCRLLRVDPTNVLHIAIDCGSGSFVNSASDGLGNLIVSRYSSPSGSTIGALDLTSPKFALSTNRADVGMGNGSGTFTVTSDPVSAPWTATSDMPWLQVSPSSGTGAATLTYSYVATNTVNTRTGKLTVGAQTLTVYQAGATPTFTLSANSDAFSGQASNGTVNLTVTPTDAQWRITGNPSWLTVLPSTAVGNATLTFGVPANPSTDSRTGAFSVVSTICCSSPSSAPFTVTQAPAATAALAPSNTNVGASAGSLTVQLTTTPPGAAWSASADSWLNVTPWTGSGDTVLTVSYPRNNTSKSRTGTVSVGNQKLTITQAGSPVPYSFWPTSWWGQIITIGGGGNANPGDSGPATSASLDSPNRIAVDTAGNVYFTGSQGIRRIDAANAVISTVSTGPTSYASLGGIAINSSGDLYFTNYSAVYKLPRSGGTAQVIAGGGSTLGDGGPATAAQLTILQGIALDQSGNLFIADGGAHRIRKVNLSTGIITTVAGIGTPGFSGDGGPATQAQLRYPWGVALDSAGNLYIADFYNQRIRRVAAATGLISTIAGGGSSGSGDGGLASNATVNSPNDIKVSPSGDLFLSDDNRIRRIDSATGVISTVAGTGYDGDGPDGDSAIGTAIGYGLRIALDEIGNLYIADSQKGKIRYVDYVSPRSTLSPEKLAVPVAAGSTTVQLTALASTGAWKLTNNTPSWLTVSPTIGTGDTSLSLTYSANTSSAARTGTFTVRGQLFNLTQAGVSLLTLSRTSVYFGALVGGSVATSPAAVTITQTSGPAGTPWSTSTDQPWCNATPVTGAGTGTITISVNGNSLPASVNSTCKVTVTAPGANFSPFIINAYLKQIVPAASQPPFGAYDTPPDNTGYASGSIAITGWALDDIGVKLLSIWRDPVGSEPVQPNGYVYIADAAFISGSRPDLQATFAGYPNANRAAWSYSLPVSALLGKGTSTFKLHAIAVDEEGNSVKLGTKTITVGTFNTISGQVLTSGVGQPGVTITLSGAQSRSATTDASGNYGFANLPANSAYTVTPTKAGYTFTPPDLPFTSLVSNQVANFSATASNLAAVLSLDRTRLNFAARDAATLSPAQKIVVSFGGGSAPWTASANQSWLQVSPVSGTGSTRLTVSINPAILPPSGTAIGTLTISAPTATPTSKTVTVYLTRVATPSPPFGAFDTPTNNATKIAGSIAVTGWAMDDVAVSAVRIYRDKIGNEGVQPNGYVYIGDAVFVPNARGDIEGLNPTLPASYRAGWGYLMLTNAIPGGSLPQGNGTIRLWAIATDVEGNSTNLGSKIITLDNANSKLPFGAIDSPGQGGIAIDTVNNSGWIMTPQPNTMAAVPAYITAYVDGVPVGSVTYGQPRGDVAGLFPSYRNSGAPGATFSLDTTLYSNAMHSIFWIAYDNAGNGDGIGSRYFFIENGLSAGIANPTPPVLSTVRAARTRPQRAAVPQVRTAQELERLVIDLPEGTWTGAHIINGEPQPLPVGSTLDNTNGAFYWHLGPGFLGRHELLFTSTDGAVYGVTVNIKPKTFGASE